MKQGRWVVAGLALAGAGCGGLVIPETRSLSDDDAALDAGAPSPNSADSGASGAFDGGDAAADACQLEEHSVADDCEIIASECPDGGGAAAVHVRCKSTGMIALPHGLDGLPIDACDRIDDDETGFVPEYCCAVPTCIRRHVRDCSCSSAVAFQCAAASMPAAAPATCTKITDDAAVFDACCVR